MNNLPAKFMTFAFVTIAFFSGSYITEVNQPEPCIRNFEQDIGNHPFAPMHQEAINDTEQRLQYEGTADERLTSGREFTLELFEYLAGLSPNETHMMAVRGESFITHDTYYVVPQNCYATDLDSLSGPTLWRMN